MSGSDFMRELGRLSQWVKPSANKKKDSSSGSGTSPQHQQQQQVADTKESKAKKVRPSLRVASVGSPTSTGSAEQSPQNSPPPNSSLSSVGFTDVFSSTSSASQPSSSPNARDRSSLAMGTSAGASFSRGSTAVGSSSSSSSSPSAASSLPPAPPVDMVVLNNPEYHVHISICLANPLYKANFRAFARKEKSEENIAFLEEVAKYRALPATQLGQKARQISEMHLSASAQQQVNLSDSITKSIFSRIIAAEFTTDLFDKAAREITLMLQNDSYSRYKLSSPDYTRMQESHLWAPLRANASAAPPASRRIVAPLSQQLADNEMIFWEWDDYGKWLRFPLAVNMALLCAEHRGCTSVRFAMCDARVRVDLAQQRVFHSPSNSCRALRRTLVTSDLLCTLASRLHQLLLDRAAAADSLAMLRANMKQRLIDDRSLAPSSGLLEQALSAAHRSDPHAILMAAASSGTRPQLAMPQSRLSIAGPSIIGASTSSLMSGATSENLIAAQILRDDMMQTISNVTKLKVICQERIGVLTSLAAPLTWPPAPQHSSPSTPVSARSRSSSLSQPMIAPPPAGAPDDTLSSPLQLPSIPEQSTVAAAPIVVPAAPDSIGINNSSPLPVFVPVHRGSSGESKIMSDPSTHAAMASPTSVAATTSSGAASSLVMPTRVTIHRAGSATTLSNMAEEKEVSRVYDALAMMTVSAQRAEADFANAIIDGPSSVSSFDLDSVYDLITRMSSGPMSPEKHAELDRMWLRLVELRQQSQAAITSLEPLWANSGAAPNGGTGFTMNPPLAHIGGMWRATQQFDALIQTFANALSLAETQLWAIFGPLRAAIRFVNDLIHSRLKQAKEELERDIDKMETICSLYFDQLKILDMYLNLPRDLSMWLQEAALAHEQYIGARAAAIPLEASIITAKAAGDMALVTTLTSRLRVCSHTQIARRKAQSRWIRKLSEAARTGWCHELWRHQLLAWAKFKNSDALAAEGILSSLRELSEYKGLKDMTPSHVTHCQILYGRRHERPICLKRYHLLTDDARSIFLRSCRSWSSLNHIGLMRIRALFFDGEYGYIETMLPGGGTLRDWLQRSGGCPLDAKYLVVRRLCETVGYLHSNQLSHHDISIETVGINESGSPILFEPNMSSLNDGGTGSSLLTGSERWWLPRMGVSNQFQGVDMKLRQDDMRYRDDIYQLGSVIYRIYGSTGGSILDVNKMYKQLGEWPPLPMAPESANLLLGSMLHHEPAARLTLATSLKLDFFKRPPSLEVSDMKLMPPPTCRSWQVAQEVLKSMAVPAVYLDRRYDKCWCSECIPRAPVPADPLASLTPPSPIGSRRSSSSSGGPSTSTPSTPGPTIALPPAYGVSGSDEQRYTLPYGMVQIGLRVEPRFKNGQQVRIWDEWKACYYGMRCDSIDNARVTLTSMLTGSLAQPVDVDGSLRRAAFRVAAVEAATSSPTSPSASLARSQSMSSPEREPLGVPPQKVITTTPSIAYASIAAHARRMESNDGKHQVALVLRCHQHPDFQVAGQTVGGFIDPLIPSDTIEWRTTHDHHVITSLLLRVSNNV